MERLKEFCKYIELCEYVLKKLEYHIRDLSICSEFNRKKYKTVISDVVAELRGMYNMDIQDMKEFLNMFAKKIVKILPSVDEDGYVEFALELSLIKYKIEMDVDQIPSQFTELDKRMHVGRLVQLRSVCYSTLGWIEVSTSFELMNIGEKLKEIIASFEFSYLNLKEMSLGVYRNLQPLFELEIKKMDSVLKEAYMVLTREANKAGINKNGFGKGIQCNLDGEGNWITNLTDFHVNMDKERYSISNITEFHVTHNVE